MSKTIADWRDGWLCIKYTDTAFSTPEEYSHWWPVRRCDRSEVESIIGLQAFSVSNDAYAVREMDRPGGFWVDLPLLNGGQTQPIYTNVRAVLCPNVRKGLDVRYQSGRWEKYLKTQGWVAA